jgi:hypothetical protein
MRCQLKNGMVSVSVLAAMLLAAGCAPRNGVPSADKATKSQQLLTSLPAPARLTVLRETSGGLYRRTFSEEQLGATIHVVDYTSAAGAAGEIQVTGDGRVLDRDEKLETITFAQVPDRVRQSMLSQTGGVKPKFANRHARGNTSGSPGREIYLMDVALAGVPYTYSIDTNGSVLQAEMVIPAKQLPVVVEAALRKPFQDIAFREVREVRRGADVSYRITGSSAGKSVTTVIGADGTTRSTRLN